MRPRRILLPLNGQLQVAGEIFLNHEVGLDLDDLMVFIWHPWSENWLSPSMTGSCCVSSMRRSHPGFGFRCVIRRGKP